MKFQEKWDEIENGKRPSRESKLSTKLNSVKDKAKKTLLLTGIFATLGLGGQALYTAASTITNVGFRYLGAETKDYTGTFVKQGISQSPGTKGRMNWADFKLDSGDIIHLSDAAAPLEGKMFPNTLMGNYSQGAKYELSGFGSDNLGYILLGIRRTSP